MEVKWYWTPLYVALLPIFVAGWLLKVVCDALFDMIEAYEAWRQC